MLKISVTLSLFIVISCSENSTDFRPEPNSDPGRRDYIWTVDTITSFNSLKRLWGSSSTDVWAITRGTFYEDIYHFDGLDWRTDGEFRLFSPSSIWGFSRNKVYIGGGSGKIWYYDGNNWQETAALTKDGHTDITFNNMWGESTEDLYAFGAYGDDEGLLNNSVIAHYNGSSWKILNTDGLVGIVASLYKNQMDRTIYMQVINFSNTYDTTYIYEYNNEIYKQLYKTIWSNTWAGISLIDDDVYFILKDEIAIRNNQQFETVLNLDNYNFYQKIWGRNRKDIFILMTDGLAHYNGNDVEYLFYFDKTNTQIFSAVLFNDEVFFLVYEYSTGISLIYRGN